ncbi:MAG TPA: Holliday junction ATP-dependent DNA helicase RuvA [Sphaerochaeta sp.]|jgi:Holliday junction DNA helicase RuvA|nr:Holliday junction ATP-dependent DNA helicase RuvA [Sphaerochaeta sp.]
MINAVIGDIIQLTESEVIIRAGHIEYALSITAQTASKLSNLVGEQRLGVRLLTVLIHRDDSMTLIGFLDHGEREAFLQLQTVSGIGVKQALKILGGISVRNLIEALDSGNVKLLSSIPGIGPKTGQKMILALRNVLVLDEEESVGRRRESTQRSKWNDITDALVDMGYDRRRVEQLIDEQTEVYKEKIATLGHHEAEELLFRQAIKLLA